MHDPNNFCSAYDRRFFNGFTYHCCLFNAHTMIVPEKSKNVNLLYPDKVPDGFNPNNYCSACDRTFASRLISTVIIYVKRIYAIRIRGLIKPRVLDKKNQLSKSKNVLSY